MLIKNDQILLRPEDTYKASVDAAERGCTELASSILQIMFNQAGHDIEDMAEAQAHKGLISFPFSTVLIEALQQPSQPMAELTANSGGSWTSPS